MKTRAGEYLDAESGPGSLDGFLAFLTAALRDDAPVDVDAVELLTFHRAKGLEFHTVFVIWLTDGMFPSSRSLLSTEAIEEERRLFYVASTRAQDQLFLTYPYYSFNGSPENRLQRPSRFLKEIPSDLVEELWVTTENKF